MSQIYQYELEVTPELVDTNGHVNNVTYLQWMQTAALEHARSSGCTAATLAVGASWVVRSHHIEYLRPLFAGDRVRLLTWVADFRKVRSLRKYKLILTSNQALVAQAETDWVFVDGKTGRPRPIPEEVQRTLPPLPAEQEP